MVAEIEKIKFCRAFSEFETNCKNYLFQNLPVFCKYWKSLSNIFSELNFEFSPEFQFQSEFSDFQLQWTFFPNFVISFYAKDLSYYISFRNVGCSLSNTINLPDHSLSCFRRKIHHGFANLQWFSDFP